MGPNLEKEDALPRVTFQNIMVCHGDSHQTPELSNWEWHVSEQKKCGYGWCLFRLWHIHLWLHEMSLITDCLGLLLWEPWCTLEWSSCLSTTLGRETSSFWHWSRIWQVRTAECSNTLCYLSDWTQSWHNQQGSRFWARKGPLISILSFEIMTYEQNSSGNLRRT